ncbi:MAG: hemolysin family protein [Eubacteriales bacterium]|nr:hemolysin family protein [Eubacteriales bacterium]
MDGDIWGSILLLILLSIGAAYCASSEIAYASLDLFKAERQADKGNKRAKKAIYISENFDKALTTILILNNITHIAFASIATAMATRLWGVASVAWVTLASTIYVFFFTEMLPKSYAKGSFDFALRLAPSLKFFMDVLTPISAFFTLISTWVDKFFKLEETPDITEEEFYSIVQTINEEAVLEEEKRNLLNSSIAFGKLHVSDCYQPLENLDSINVDATNDEIFRQVKESPYSRLPVYEGKPDHIIGILRVRHFLKDYIKGKDIHLRDLLTTPTKASFDMEIDELFKKMSLERNHIAVVVDSEGRTRGIITLEDILEELVGDIWDENDEGQLNLEDKGRIG